MKYSKCPKNKRKIKESLSSIHGEICQYCGNDTPINSATIDHSIPQSEFGTGLIDNLVYCCKSCNSAKNNRSLSEFRLIRSIQASPYSGILTFNQYLKLNSLGLLSFSVELIQFQFEKVSSHE